MRERRSVIQLETVDWRAKGRGSCFVTCAAKIALEGN